MKVIKYLLLALLNMAVPAVAAQQKVAMQEAPAVDTETEKQIDDLLNALVVPKTIVDYAKEDNWEKVKELAVQKDTDVNVQNHYGQTALMLAAMWLKLDVVQALLQAGASVNTRDGGGNTALIAAELGYFLVIVKALAPQFDVEKHPALKSLLHSRQLEIVKLLLQAGADITAKNNRGDTALTILTHDVQETGNKN